MTENMDSACRKSRLKELLDIGSEIRQKDVVEDKHFFEKISEIIKETDSINRSGDIQERAHSTTEVVMDAQVVQMSHELVGEAMQKMDTSEFSETEWINAIISIVYKNDNENWDGIAEIACEISKMCRFAPCLLTDCDFRADSEEKVLKERQKRNKSARAEEIQPQNLSQIEKREGNTQNVMIIYKQILKIYLDNDRQPIPYYKLVIDPHNFMNSVDNAFQIAFLARDKSVKIFQGDDGLPLIQPLNKEEKSNAPNETKQAICTLDMNFSNEMIKKYNIKEALLKKTKAERV